MAMKVPVQIDGKTVEVELPAGLLTEADVQARFITRDAHDHELERQTAAARRAAVAEAKAQGGLADPKELLENEEFKTSALTKWGVNGKGKLAPEEIEALRTDITTKLVTPLQEKLKSQDTTIGRLLHHRLVNELVQQGTGVLKDHYLKPAREGADPLVVKLFEDVVRYDAETDGYYAFDPRKNGGAGGFVPSAKGTRERPYVGIGELFESFVGDKQNEPYLRDDRQRGAGVQADGGNGGGSKDVVLSKAQGSDGPTYRAAMEKAAKQGGVVVVQ